MDMIFYLLFFGAMLYSVAAAGKSVWKIAGLLTRRATSQREMWPSATGEVVHREVKTRWTNRGGKSFHPEVTYEFAVMGKRYSRKILLGVKAWDTSAQKALSEVSDRFEVRYHPENPERNVAEVEKIQMVDVMGVVVVLVMIAVIVVMVMNGGLGLSGRN